jgi:methylglutaconyl-CoA hydratase
MDKIFNSILLNINDGVARLELNRPEKHNAFNAEMIAELTAAFTLLAEQQSLRLVILSGNGPSFSAGADLHYMKEISGFGYEENLRDAQKLAGLFETVKNCAVPVMAVVHGAVFGGANGLSAACDIVLAHENTVFAFSEVKLGITPATISPFVIARCGEAAARELMLTGRKFTASEAYRFMLVNQVFQSENQEELISTYIRQLLSSGPMALKACKTLIQKVTEPHKEKAEILNFTTKQIAELRASEEGQEGLAAFFDKRKPNWIP